MFLDINLTATRRPIQCFSFRVYEKVVRRSSNQLFFTINFSPDNRFECDLRISYNPLEHIFINMNYFHSPFPNQGTIAEEVKRR